MTEICRGEPRFHDARACSWRDVCRGALREQNPQVVIALALGLLMQGFLDPEGADWDQVTNEGFAILLNGLQV